MSLPTVKGIQPIPENEAREFGAKYPEFVKWFRLLGGAFPRVRTFSQALTPTAVSANSESAQTFTIQGLQTSDVVIVNKPSNQTDLSLLDAYVSAANTLTLKYRNFSGGSITPTAETYRIVGIRL